MKIISLEHITVRRGNRTNLDDVSLDVGRGDFVAVTGPNGGGKTTLLRVILRLLKPDSGSVTYYDKSGHSTGLLSIGYLPQKNMIDSRFPITVREVIESGLMGVGHADRSVSRQLVDEMIADVGLETHSDAAIGTLSGGQMQRALLGRALISAPELLVLDEPLSYVDKQFEHRIYEILADVRCRSTVILVSHEMSAIAPLANRHIIIDRQLSECQARCHTVHYDCDEPAANDRIM